ncbi:hypothetical protein C8R45DRAFT_1094306 [Mycena sanguinolenta]|nr:hypothetical protein C8R45DRAFT_1094306 [Mycena sanguinolenta]
MAAQSSQYTLAQEVVLSQIKTANFKGYARPALHLPKGFTPPTSTAGVKELRARGHKFVEDVLANYVRSHVHSSHIAAALTSPKTIAALVRFWGHRRNGCTQCVFHGENSEMGNADKAFALYVGSFVASHTKGAFRIQPGLEHTFSFLAEKAFSKIRSNGMVPRDPETSSATQSARLDLEKVLEGIPISPAKRSRGEDERVGKGKKKPRTQKPSKSGTVLWDSTNLFLPPARAPGKFQVVKTAKYKAVKAVEADVDAGDNPLTTPSSSSIPSGPSTIPAPVLAFGYPDHSILSSLCPSESGLTNLKSAGQ